MGFSFNESPPQSVLAKISEVSRRMKNQPCADPASFRRFERHFPNAPHLPPDVAFLLEPQQPQNDPQDIFKWVQSRKAAGDSVVGINLHAHLLKHTPGLTMDQLMKASVQAILNVALAQPCSFLLIPHDTRNGSNDEDILRQMEDKLKPSLGVRIALAPGALHADEIKALVGLVDVVLTGRMHLAIAALGQSVPIGVITYNGKFEGLVEHFHLPEWLLVTPAKAGSDAVVQNILLRLLSERNGLIDLIKSRLPSVLQLSKANFNGFSPSCRIRSQKSACQELLIQIRHALTYLIGFTRAFSPLNSSCDNSPACVSAFKKCHPACVSSSLIWSRSSAAFSNCKSSAALKHLAFQFRNRLRQIHVQLGVFQHASGACAI